MTSLTDALLNRFLAALSPLAPVAVWAHGSLAGGDYQEGRSDLDLVAVMESPTTPGTVRRVVALHRRLRAEPLAAGLHCTYLTPDTTADTGRSHLTWAHGHAMRRPVTPVTRRELHAFGRVLHGRSPAELLPTVTDRELAEFVVRDQREFWRPNVDKARLWRQDVWVDLGLLTYARATATLREGRLMSKREALDALPGLGAPMEVVADIERRRYERPGEPDGEWLDRRGELTRTYLGPAIDELVKTYG
ncbi:nucleotidyltransferase domain-containing protein [Streptomyces sp. NBC_01235]|uniref:nucleotidyltransferase domain-containing protein n=1 Tax=Streptomyces sp. NBC_01235 TaxID=2903788 RepID=UPI002E0F9E4D|nr:nucleotidyltransferase domain-containing protein [Streptomyces sp. NBC_01235]